MLGPEYNSPRVRMCVCVTLLTQKIHQSASVSISNSWQTVLVYLCNYHHGHRQRVENVHCLQWHHRTPSGYTVKHLLIMTSLLKLFPSLELAFAFVWVLYLRAWTRNDSRISYLACNLVSIGDPCIKACLKIFVFKIECELDKVCIFGVSRSICFELRGGGGVFVFYVIRRSCHFEFLASW